MKHLVLVLAVLGVCCGDNTETNDPESPSHVEQGVEGSCIREYGRIMYRKCHRYTENGSCVLYIEGDEILSGDKSTKNSPEVCEMGQQFLERGIDLNAIMIFLGLN